MVVIKIKEIYHAAVYFIDNFALKTNITLERRYDGLWNQAIEMKYGRDISNNLIMNPIPIGSFFLERPWNPKLKQPILMKYNIEMETILKTWPDMSEETIKRELKRQTPQLEEKLHQILKEIESQKKCN